MKKRYSMALVVLALNASLASGAQDEKEVRAKIESIDEEIVKTEQLIKSGESDQAFKDHLRSLQTEKKRYSKLLKKSSRRSQQTYTDQTAIKTIPQVVRKDLEARNLYQDQSLPLEKRLNLTLYEISSLNEMNKNLSQIPEKERTKGVIDTIKANEEKLKELEALRVDYELKINEAEEQGVMDMRKSGVRVGVIADLYYQWDFNKPGRNSDTSGEIPYKNYTNRHNDFTINLLELNFAKSYKGTDFYADIDFGEQPLQNNYLTSDDDSVTRHVGQAFLRHQFESLDGVTLTAGKFYTHFGLETPKNTENRNYSRPVYYNLVCPFWHEGVALTKSGMGPFGAGVYIYDKTDKRVDNNSGKVYGGQLTYNSEKLSAVFNTISGSEQDSAGNTREGNMKTQHEVILTYKLNDRITLITDALMGSNKKYDATTGRDTRWSAIVGYVDMKLTQKDSITARVENFRDLTSSKASNNLFTTTANPNAKAADVMAYTLTNRYNLGNGAEFRAEARIDQANADLYPTQSGSFRRHQATVMMGWLYSI